MLVVALPSPRLTRTVRGLVSELELTAADDGVPSDSVVSFDNISDHPSQHLPPKDCAAQPKEDGKSLSASARRDRLLTADAQPLTLT